MSRASLARCLIPALILVLATVPGLRADPPAQGPPCNVQLAPLFCFRLTDIAADPVVPDRFRLEFEVVNWTATDAAGLVLSLNVGGCGQPLLAGASVDALGRPLGPVSTPPSGNTLIVNDWTASAVTPSQIVFTGGTAIAHAQATVSTPMGPVTFDGLLDPDFATAPQMVCEQALTTMIPGSTVVPGSPSTILTPPESVDDGPNIRDGFVIEIASWAPGAQLSINWHFIDAQGCPIGIVSTQGVMGDEYGFGTVNLVRLAGGSPTPLFDRNTGYDPPDDTDPDQDSPRFFAEDEVAGVDSFPINPIPAGDPGAGTYLAVEFGAAVTAPFAVASDATFCAGGTPITSAVNLDLPPGPGQPGVLGVAALDVNLSLNANCTPVGTTYDPNGPFFAELVGGQSMSMHFDGAPNQPIILLGGALNPGASTAGPFGQIDLGLPGFLGVIIVADGTAPAFPDILYNTGPAGAVTFVWPLPLLPPGIVIALQAAIFHPTLILGVTNAVELTVL